MFQRFLFSHILRNCETKGNAKIEEKRTLSFSPLPLFVSPYAFVNVYLISYLTKLSTYEPLLVSESEIIMSNFVIKLLSRLNFIHFYFISYNILFDNSLSFLLVVHKTQISVFLEWVVADVALVAPRRPAQLWGIEDQVRGWNLLFTTFSVLCFG